MTLDRPYFAQMDFDSNEIAYPSFFIVEPGSIQLTITDWKERGIPSGTPINDEYA
ncbi:MAG: DUF4369 domain-containing protein [Rikenellaceae bacterium]|nr:DUF4369 domain-containing protein [Rikenellaceae bacterium]